MFEFAWWWMLFCLPLPLIFYALPARKTAQVAALKVPVLPSGLPDASQSAKSSRSRLFWASIAWLVLVLASARPQWLGEPVSIPAEGRDLMIAVDLSGSMKFEDMQVNGRQVNRLVMIKSVLKDFIERRIGDRLGLILFADTAYLQAPLTYDRQTVQELLGETVIGLVGDQTAIGDAIGLAIKRFQSKKESNKVLILLTDGQNTAGNISPDQALELAVNEEITIYTIGVGADKMIVNNFFGRSQVNPAQDLDEEMLSRIAQQTGGQYFRARDTQSLERIYATLDELEPVERDERQLRPLTALYYYPLALAVLISALIVLWPLLPKTNWLRRETIHD